MRRFNRLVMPLSTAGSDLIDRALSLAKQLDATLFVVETPTECFEQRALAAIDEYNADLLIICERQTDSFVVRSLMQHSPVPVLVIPTECRASLTWSSILVPMSGEARSNIALATAVGLARDLGIPVDVIHVSSPALDKSRAPQLLDQYLDQAHHEFPYLVDQFIAQAVPYSTYEEKRWIRDFCFCRGEVTMEIEKMVRERRSGLIALEWHGQMSKGRARILKRLLAELGCPILLLRTEPPRLSRSRPMHPEDLAS